MKKVYLLIIGILLTVAGISAVNANPSQFMRGFASNTSSTLAAPTYTLAGKATSTVTIYDQSSAGNKYDKALVHFQVTSTTTPPTVLFRVETSDNNSTWYSYNNATSTGALTPTVYSFTYASTSYSSYNNSGDQTKVNGSFMIDINAPYVRLVSYSPIGNPAYNIFIEADVIKEIR